MDLDFGDQRSDQVTTTKAGARFKPKAKLRPPKNLSTSQKLQTETKEQQHLGENTSSSAYLNSYGFYIGESVVPDNEDLNQSNFGTFAQEIVWGMVSEPEPEPPVLRACTNIESSGKRSDDLEVPERQEYAMFNDFVSPETVGEECHLDMETLDIVQESSTIYEQHTGKFQPKPRLLETVIEEQNNIVNDEHEARYSADDTGYFAMGATESEFMVNEESRNDFNINAAFYDDFGDELNIPQVPGETVSGVETGHVSGGWEHNKHVDSPSTNTVIREEKKAVTSKGAAGTRKRKNNNEELTKSSEKPVKKFKHSTRRQRRTLEKELLETPEDEIRYLPIRDMLRLVDYKEWLEKKEAKAAVATQTQESTMNTQGGDEEDFGLDSNDQEIIRAKPDSPVNYHSHMNRTARTRWSKQDTELFYEGIREFGSNLSMVQQLFSDRSREQIKLKFKLEERRHPLKLNDALSSRSKHHIHFQNVIKKLQEEAAAAQEGEEVDEEDEEGAGGENIEEAEITDLPENEVPPKSEEVKSDGGEAADGVRSDGGDGYDDDGDGDADYWSAYKSDI